MRSLAHLADRVIMIEPLKTGLANDVTGRIRRITRNGEEEEDLFKLGEKSAERVIRGLIRNWSLIALFFVMNIITKQLEHIFSFNLVLSK